MNELTNHPTELQERLHHEIPLSSQMGVLVTEVSESHVVLHAPLGPNINHKSTAFGGSVHSLAVLSCWALVSKSLEQIGSDVGYVVVQDSQIDYISPISHDFEAKSSWESPQARDRFFETLRRKGLARVRLTSVVSCRGEKCAELTARFAAQIEKL